MLPPGEPFDIDSFVAHFENSCLNGDERVTALFKMMYTEKQFSDLFHLVNLKCSIGKQLVSIEFIKS